MECELDMCDHGDVRVISFIMARRPPRSARSDTLFPTRRSCDLASRRSRALAPQHEVNRLPRPEEGEARLEGRPQGSGLSSSTLPAAASSHFVNDAALAFALRRSGGTTMAIDGTQIGRAHV